MYRFIPKKSNVPLYYYQDLYISNRLCYKHERNHSKHTINWLHTLYI